MPTVCIQCSLKALLNGQDPPTFDESPEAHTQRCHADPLATLRERHDLERRLADKLKDMADN